MQIIKDKSIDFLDERFYPVLIKGVQDYYPSVTYILGEGYHKGHGFEQFLKDHGENSRVVADRAAECGTIVHDCLHRLTAGEELIWTDPLKIPMKYHGEYISKEEWEAVLKFADFHRTYQPKLLASELTLFSKKYRLAGTVDYVCEFGGDRWLIDYKFSNAVYESMELQIAAYVYMWNITHPKRKINRMGILHLKALTRGEDKKGKVIQGDGWKLHEPKMEIKDLWQAFLAVYSVFKFKQDRGLLPKEPSLISYPITVKL
jgi:hypothetical protein